MATKTWNGSDTSWNTAGNWSPSGVPGASDDVVFDGTSNQACICDVAIDVASLDVQSGHSGDLDFGDSAYSHAISGNATFDGSGEIDCGDATITSGGNFDYKDQTTWTKGTSTVALTGAGKTLTPKSSSQMTSLTISGTITQDNALVIVNNVTIDEGASYTVGSGASELRIAVTAAINGTLSISSGKQAGLKYTTDRTITIGANGVITGAGTFNIQGGYPTTDRWHEIDNSAGGTFNPALVTFIGSAKLTGSVWGGAWTCTCGTGNRDEEIILLSEATFTGNFSMTNDDDGGYDFRLTGCAANFKGDVTLANTGTGGTTFTVESLISLDGHADQTFTHNDIPLDGGFRVRKTGGTVTPDDTIDIDSGHLLLIGTENNQCTLSNVDFDLATGVTGIVQNMKLQDCGITHADTGYLVPAALADNVVDLGGNTGFDFKRRCEVILD